MKFIIPLSSLIFGLIAGSLVTYYITKNPSTTISKKEIIAFHKAEISKGTLVANNKEEDVIVLIKSLVEHGICKDHSLQYLYEDEEDHQSLSRFIKKFYSALNEAPPVHVAQWMDTRSLTFDTVEDALSFVRSGQSKKAEVLTVREIKKK